MIRSDLELDLPALVGALRSTPVLHGTALVDSAEQIIAGPTSYQLMDEGFGLHIQNQHWLQPFRYRLIRRNYVTIQFTQSGAYRLHGDGQIRRVRAGSVRLNAMPESVSEFRQATTVRGASIFMEREQLIECFGLLT